MIGELNIGSAVKYSRSCNPKFLRRFTGARRWFCNPRSPRDSASL